MWGNRSRWEKGRQSQTFSVNLSNSLYCSTFTIIFKNFCSVDKTSTGRRNLSRNQKFWWKQFPLNNHFGQQYFDKKRKPKETGRQRQTVGVNLFAAPSLTASKNIHMGNSRPSTKSALLELLLSICFLPFFPPLWKRSSFKIQILSVGMSMVKKIRCLKNNPRLLNTA